MLDPSVFIISRIILFFVATIFVYKAMQSVELSKIFKPNSSDQIRFLFIVISIILGYLFVDVFISLFEQLNSLF
ncbi:MAG: DUF1146 family protein [Firmicutes bacterium]|nr:DUF1146 family protein [Bacillota bacterium]